MIMHNMPAAFAVLCGIAIIAATIIELRNKPRKMLAVLAALRLGALILILMLLNSFQKAGWEETKLPHNVVLLKDVSASMSMLSEQTTDELRTMENALRNAAKQNPAVRFEEYVFAGSLAKPDRAVEAGQSATALGDALLSVNRLHPNADIFISSDGASNSGIHPALAASMLTSSSAKTHVFLPRELESGNAFDLSVSDAVQPSSWKSDKKVFSATVRANNPATGKHSGMAKFKAELKIDGAKMASGEFTADSNIKDVSLALPPDTKLAPGWHEFEIAVSDSSEREATNLNNSAKGIFRSFEDEAVMVIWDRVDPDLNALRPTLEQRYSKLDFSYAAQFMQKSPDAQCAEIDSWVLLITASPATIFSQKAIEKIQSKLEAGRLSIIIVNPKAADSFLKIPGFAKYLPFRSPGERLPPEKEMEIEFSQSGTKFLMPIRTLYSFLPASNLMVKAYTGPVGGRRTFPAVIANKNIALMAFTGTWRWKISPDRKTALSYESFWDNLLSSCDNYGRKGLYLSADERNDSLSKNVYIFTLSDYIRGKDGNSDVQEVWLWKENPGGKPVQVRKMPVNSDGFSSAILQILSPGVHWFYAEIDNSEHRRSNRVPVMIPDNTRETLDYAASGRILALTAEKGSGAQITPDNLKKMDSLLKFKPSKLRIRKEVPPDFSRDILYAAGALLLLAAEWLLRRIEDNNANA